MNRFSLILWTILPCVGFSEAHCNKTSTFVCPKGYCISIAKVCDGVKDCEGGEDEEENCGEWSCHDRAQHIADANGYPCRKSCEEEDECIGRLKSCMCDEECGLSCYNDDATCDAPPTVKHALLSIYKRRDDRLRRFFGAPTYGCVAKYTCEEGYRLEGPMPRCSAKRTWSKLAPRCVRISCEGPVPKIPNTEGYIFSRLIKGKEKLFSKERAALVGTTVQYTCKEGLRLYGELPKCSDDLTWTVTEAMCRVPCHDRAITPDVPCGTVCDTDSDCPEGKKCYCDGECGRSCVNTNINCGNAPIVASATLGYTNETGIKRVARYACDIGYYRRSGRSTLTCTGSGQWSGTPPVCALVYCGDPSRSIEHTGGYIENFTGLSYGSTLTFACRSKRYDYYGPKTKKRTCMENGRWSGLLAICDEIDDIERCPHPGVPINGRLLDNDKKFFKVDQTVRFQCDEGYVMYGPNRRTCLWTKEWTGDKTPTCEDPKYRHSRTDIVASLRKSLSALPDYKTSLGRSINANSNKGQEVYFLFDISASALSKPEELKQEFEFAKRLVKRLSEFNGYINYGIMVFALNNVTALDIAENIKFPPSPDHVIGILEDVYQRAIDHKYEKRAKLGTNTHVALQHLREMIAFSNEQNKTKDNKRHVFIFTDGKHTAGDDPTKIRKKIQLEFGKSIEFYSITACRECTDENAQKELKGLASCDKNYVYIEDIYQLTAYLDQVTNVTIDFSKCGQAGDVRIIKQQATPILLGRSINSEKANEDGWPWQALITYKKETPQMTLEDSSVKGGGSIINRKWILTAAHIFQGDSRAWDWKSAYVVSVGIFERPKKGQNVVSSAQMFSMADFLEHNGFDQDTFANDIALIKLGPKYNSTMGVLTNVDSIEYGHYVRPVCLPCKGTCITEKLLEPYTNDQMSFEEKCLQEEKLLLEPGVKVVSTGFGLQERVENGIRNIRNPVLPRQLQQALLKLGNKSECELGAKKINKDAGQPINYTENMLCCLSGDRTKTIDMCQGDSGGPVVREVRDKTTSETCWTQIGIVSFGWGCGRDDLPGYYTNVVKYISWINETMRETDAES